MLEMILAVDNNGCIGKNGDLPWKLPTDMKHFKEKTINKVIVMGFATWVSLGKKDLPMRENLILSRRFTGEKFINDISEVVKLSRTKHVVVIGGAEIYNQLAEYADKIFLTKVDTIVEGGDTFFDMSLLHQFTKVTSELLVDNGYNIEFATYLPK